MGPGIPEDKQRVIFQRFERAKMSKNISGLGLGLFLSRAIVKAHHGKISLRSKSGSGVTFVVTIPLRPEFSVAPAIDLADVRLTK
jgi:signal transduction histidine kinase